MSSIDEELILGYSEKLHNSVSSEDKMKAGGIGMYARLKGVIFAFVLGVVLPSLLIAMLDMERRQSDESTPADPTAASVINEEQLSVLMPDGLIQSMNLEEYIVGVVLNEMPIDFELEALKAQAVVARTYALKRCEHRGKHVDADVCTDSDCCQGYRHPDEYCELGGTADSVQKAQNAVNLTRGLVLVYEDNLIDATYFSCSGGVTEDAEAVWGFEVPYLRSTDSPGEERAKYFVDTVTFTRKEFLDRLNIENMEEDKVYIDEITYTVGGGVDTIRVCEKTIKGTDFRHCLGLRSTSLIIHVVGDTVTITTKGYGHRVGMSQYGAEAMAVNGALFPEILTHYYQGTHLETYNKN